MLQTFQSSDLTSVTHCQIVLAHHDKSKETVEEVENYQRHIREPVSMVVICHAVDCQRDAVNAVKTCVGCKNVT